MAERWSPVPVAAWRASYAADPSRPQRVHDEPASPTRSPFQRDADRIVHATAFRRLKDKTQVFAPVAGDHYRTRLTHTLEVSRIARALARTLRLDEDLAEAIALVHDIGHPPFGHAGERALATAMAERGGFNHNAQALRIVTRLERRYAAFDGLNLSRDVLEGIAKHNGPVADVRAAAELGAAAGIVLDLAYYPSAEAQVAAIADDIAYNAHDIDDGLRAGLIDIDDLGELPGIGAILGEVRERYPGIETPRAVNELTRRLITLLIDGAADEAQARIASLGIKTLDHIRRAGQPVVAFSPATIEIDRALKAFLAARVYRHPEVMRVMTEAEGVVRALYRRYVEDPAALPPEWRREAEGDMPARDFLAGMTDGFALAEYRRLFDRKVEFG